MAMQARASLLAAGILGLASLANSSTANAAVILVDFKAFNPGTTSAQTPVGGTTSFYNNFGSTTSNNPPAVTTPVLMKDSANANTDVSLAAPSFFGFLNSTNGNKIDFNTNGFTFAANVMDDYIADNFSSPRDGLIQLRFSSPTQYHYDFTAALSNHTGQADGSGDVAAGGSSTLINVGGTYVKGATTGSFTGGTTVTVDPSEGTTDQASAVLAGDSVFDSGSGTYIIDLNVGMGTTIALINALKVDVSPVPEPASVAIFGLVGSALLMRRQRGR